VTTDYYAPRFDVRISGVTLSADVTQQVLSVRYDSDLDVAEMFSIVLYNPDNKLLDSALFDLGKTVEIHMGYGYDLQPMMLGEIASIEPEFPNNGPPTITVTGYDKSYRMRHNQPEPKQYRYVNDSLIAAQIAVENLLIPIVDPSPILHLRKPILQTESDMAFLKDRARANFFEVRVWWDKLYFQFPRPQTQAYVLEWGKNLSSYSPRIASSGAAGLQIIRSYSEDLASSIVAFAMAPDFNPENLTEKLGSAGIELLLSLGRRVSRVHNLESPVDAFVIATSLLKDILDGLYEGSGSTVGIPDLRAGSYIEIRNVGKRFSGAYRLRKARHVIDDSGYHTTFEVTQRSGGNLLGRLRRMMHEAPSPDTQEKFFGVKIGKVTANNELLDLPPDVPLGRVKVKFPDVSDDMESPWARVATPMAGSDRGMYFLPEVDDEVLVGFEGGNLSKPVVLGSLWNPNSLPPTNNSDNLNRKRMIKSKSGHTITLDDTLEMEQVVIKSKGGHTITLDDTPLTGQVQVQFQGGGSITMDAKGGVVIKGQTIELQADTTIKLSATEVDVV
jgi:phage protein D/phage baseplate assembly protein gpV